MTSWSYSKTSCAKSCLRKYKLQYIDAVQPESPHSSDLAFGSAIHVALDAMFNKDNASLVFQAYWARHGGLEYYRYNHDTLLSMGLELIRKFQAHHMPKYERWQGETRMYGEYQGHALEGTADFVGLYEGVPTLVDWKTSSNNYDVDRAHISTQLHLYAYLLHTTTSLRVKQLMYVPFVKYTCSIQRPVVVPFDESLMYDHLDNMMSYIKLIDSQHNWPKNSEACTYGTRKCTYTTLCWKKEDVK